MSAVVTQSSHPDVIHRYARFASVAMLLSIVFGALGEAYPLHLDDDRDPLLLF